jgi:hypothetical protein
MKFSHISVLQALITITSLAGAQQVSIKVTYPGDTPDAVVSAAEVAVRAAGGTITHEYSKYSKDLKVRDQSLTRFGSGLVKGFGAQVSETVVDTIAALGSDYGVLIEEDQVVAI